MRFATLNIGAAEQVCIRRSDRSWARLDKLSDGVNGDLLTLLETEPTAAKLSTILQQAEELPAAQLILQADAVYCPPYRHPRKIWGIGLNYADHAQDLSASAPDQPASFIKADHTIVGPGDEIIIPHQSQRTTAEAELGLILARTTRNTDESSALTNVFGVCPILDQTAEDILQLNPRYLTRAKNFPTFFSFGPEVVTWNEFISERQLDDVTVATYLDDQEIRRNSVSNMLHAPAALVSFHSRMMPLFTGDVISTGTPGATVIADGTLVESRVDGLEPLRNPVRAETGDKL